MIPPPRGADTSIKIVATAPAIPEMVAAGTTSSPRTAVGPGLAPTLVGGQAPLEASIGSLQSSAMAGLTPKLQVAPEPPSPVVGPQLPVSGWETLWLSAVEHCVRDPCTRRTVFHILSKLSITKSVMLNFFADRGEFLAECSSVQDLPQVLLGPWRPYGHRVPHYATIRWPLPGRAYNLQG